MASGQAKKSASYRLNENGAFVIENFNNSKPLANFFPGIAGKYGIPMWVFYVNRGQCISSFGTDGKDCSILEFQPANKAWQQTSLLGFRTFMRVKSGKKELFYEPFADGALNADFKISNRMEMSSYDLKLEEDNLSAGVRTSVEYFTVPQENFAGLVRIVTVSNISRKPITVSMLDGLPRVVCFGINNFFLKKMSRTIEAWMRVENLDNSVAFYKVGVDPIDRPQVVHIDGGNFFAGFELTDGKTRLIKPVVDPQSVFGQISDFSFPRIFFSGAGFAYPRKQQTMCKTPCGFIHAGFSLRPGEEKKYCEVIGNARSIELLGGVVKKILSPGFIAKKSGQNRQVIDDIQRNVQTRSGSWEYDLYCKQTYLDNVMRGGFPVIFGEGDPKNVYYLYSRKHGDLERDYNRFQVQPTYFSQGNGNYRDMNQNRRCDLWFNPDIGDFNVITFLNLLQADGFNPLVVKGASFTVKDSAALRSALNGVVDSDGLEKIAKLVSGKFTPGEIIHLVEDNSISVSVSGDKLLDMIMPIAVNNSEAEFGEGYWIDHWHYNLDLLENYLSVYPEKLKDLVFDNRSLTFWDSDAVVSPRSSKYILLDGKPKQLHSVIHDPEKRRMISERKDLPHSARSDHGKGRVYNTTVMNKLICLAANKMASLDPFGTGVEMESDKPNWFDALNGLPALFGSSSCETFEVKRLVLFMRGALEACRPGTVTITEEILWFVRGLKGLLDENSSGSDPAGDFSYWDKSASLKEEYRSKVKMGFAGSDAVLSADELISFLDACLKKLEAGLSRAREKDLYTGYFINEVVEYSVEGSFVKPLRFVQKPVAPFLEGQMHALRLARDRREAAALYAGAKKSVLFDKKLKMYKVTAPLSSMPEEIGRCHAFTPGWLENESIWLHMEYKYMLEVLKNGLYEEFYSDFKNALIPFQKPERYGRSILENSSFLVSSAFPYPDLHGNGFVARLSGSTVEFLQMWLVMNLGNSPFFMNDRGELNFRFAPALPGWLFNKDKTFSFRLFSDISVIYHNPGRKDTFGNNGVRPQRLVFRDATGKQVEISGDILPAPYAQQLRSRQIKSIDVYLSV